MDIEHNFLQKNVPIFYAARNNNLDLLISVLKEYPMLDIQDERGYTPLHYAASFGNLEMVHYLLISGANPKIENNAGEIPLEFAFNSKNQEVFYCLLCEATEQELKRYKTIPDVYEWIIDFEAKASAYRTALLEMVTYTVNNILPLKNTKRDGLEILLKFSEKICHFLLIQNENDAPDEWKFLIRKILNNTPLWYLHAIKKDCDHSCNFIWFFHAFNQKNADRFVIEKHEKCFESNPKPVIFNQPNAVASADVENNKKRKPENELTVEVEKNGFTSLKKTCNRNNGFVFNNQNDGNNDEDSTDNAEIGMNVEPNKYKFL